MILQAKPKLLVEFHSSLKRRVTLFLQLGADFTCAGVRLCSFFSVL
jgi:hypothetical protein